MVEQTITDFMNCIELVSKDISIYTNEDKGIRYPLNTVSLLCRVDYLELTKEELEKAKFEQQIEKKEYKMYDCNKHISKYTETKIEADRFTIIDKKVKATHIYNVSNALGIHTTLEDKEEAFKLCDEVNKKVLEVLK